MTREDRNRAQPRDTGAAAGKSERDASLKAVTDNMARLKALRLAREAAEPSRPATVAKATRSKSKKLDEKSPALAAWLADQKSGGHRT